MRNVWWRKCSTTQWTVFQTKTRNSLRWGERVSLALCPHNSGHVFISIHVALTFWTQCCHLVKAQKNGPSISFRVIFCSESQLNCFNVNSCTHNVNMGSNTVLLLFYPSLLSHIMKTSRVEVIVFGTATAQAMAKLTIHHTFLLWGVRCFSTLCLWYFDGFNRMNKLVYMHCH